MKYVQLTVAVNGELMGKVAGRNITNTPKTLRMDVGKWGLNEQQYQGRHAEKNTSQSRYKRTLETTQYNH